MLIFACFNPLIANPTKWSNTLKQHVGNLPTNCLSVFDHFVKLALKGLIIGENATWKLTQTQILIEIKLENLLGFQTVVTSICTEFS